MGSSMAGADRLCQQAGEIAVAELAGFRRELYRCLWRRPDALFELADAVLAAGHAGSLPYLSLEPGFRRGHGMVYQGLAEGGIDEEALRDLLVAVRPAEWPLVFAIDASTYPRPAAGTSPGREWHHHSCPGGHGSDGRRWPGGRSSGCPRCGSRTTRGPRRKTRSGSGPGMTRPGRRPGRSGAPDQELSLHDEKYGQVSVMSWSGLHPKLFCRGRFAGFAKPPVIKCHLIRVTVTRLPNGRTVPGPLWLWRAGPGLPDLDMIWRAYLHRFDIDHTYRFAKHALGWDKAALREPGQVSRWTWLIIAAITQLRLARPAAEDHRQRWERRRRQGKLTPGRVRRDFGRLAALAGTPARPPKPSKAGPGRPRGRTSTPAARHPVLKKAA